MKRRIPSGTELTALQRQLDELVELLATPGGEDAAAWSPALDLAQHAGNFVVTVDLPGVAATDLEVTLHGQRLIVAGSKARVDSAAGERRYHRMERGTGTFSIEIVLPGPVQAKRVRATLWAGVLRVNLPCLRDRRDTPHNVTVVEEEP